jgi:hypothetical protein
MMFLLLLFNSLVITLSQLRRSRLLNRRLKEPSILYRFVNKKKRQQFSGLKEMQRPQD